MQKVDLDRYEHDPKYRRATDLQFVQEDAPLQDMSIDMMFMAPAFNSVKGTLASSGWTGSKLLQPTKATLQGWRDSRIANNSTVSKAPVARAYETIQPAAARQQIRLSDDLEAEVQRRLAKKRLIDQYGGQPGLASKVQQPLTLDQVDHGLKQLITPKSDGVYPKYLTKY